MLPLVLVLGVALGRHRRGGRSARRDVRLRDQSWAIIFLRIRPEDVGPPAPLDEALADTESEAGALVR